MKIRLPQTDSRIAFPLLGYGLMLLIWLSLEDQAALSVALLGTGAAILFTSVWLLQRIGGQVLALPIWFIGVVLLGAIMGAASALMTAVLMFFKTGWHSHLYPDYPPPMILAMLHRMPIWAVAGLLMGLAIALLKVAITATPSPEQTAEVQP